FESTQPHLADALSEVLSRPLHETALALGYFLSISIWLAFERTFGEARLRQVSRDSLTATEQAINLEEELRAAQGDEPLEPADRVSVEQANVLKLVHEHVDAALDPSVARSGAWKETRGVDVDDVACVYRAVVLLTLCLSHAVLPVSDASRGNAELM